MKWRSQVVHVVVKDVRMGRWMILLFVVVVAAATAAALDWPVGFADVDFPWVFLAAALGAVSFAVIVQADSPATVDAFWVTRPLHPSAVFAAKLLLGLVVLAGVPLLGQLLVLLAHDTAAILLPHQLGQSTLVLWSIAATTGVLAALTRDLRTFLPVGVLCLLFQQVAVGLLEVLLAATTRTAIDVSLSAAVPHALASLAVLAATIALLAHQYLTRDVRRGIALMALLLGAEVVLAFEPVPRSPAATAAPAPAELRAARLVIDSIRVSQSPLGAQVEVDIAFAGSLPAHQYWLMSPKIRIHRRDSTALVSRAYTMVLLNSPQIVTDGVPWPAETFGFAERLTFPVSEAQREALSRGNAALTLEADIEVREAREVERLPVERGAAAARNGNRFRIADVTMAGNRPSVTLRHSSVSPDPATAGFFDWREGYEYALVNEQRAESRPLHRAHSAGATGFMIASSIEAIHARTLVAWAVLAGAAESVDRTWLDQARLVIVQWVPAGSYAVRAEAVIGR
jgi:hypothetical protein